MRPGGETKLASASMPRVLWWWWVVGVASSMQVSQLCFHLCIRVGRSCLSIFVPVLPQCALVRLTRGCPLAQQLRPATVQKAIEEGWHILAGRRTQLACKG